MTLRTRSSRSTQARGGDLAGDDRDAGLDQGLAGHAGALVLRQDGVEDGVGDLVRDLVRVAFGNGLGGEEVAAHRWQISLYRDRWIDGARIIAARRPAIYTGAGGRSHHDMGAAPEPGRADRAGAARRWRILRRLPIQRRGRDAIEPARDTRPARLPARARWRARTGDRVGGVVQRRRAAGLFGFRRGLDLLRPQRLPHHRPAAGTARRARPRRARRVLPAPLHPALPAARGHAARLRGLPPCDGRHRRDRAGRL